MIQSNLYRHTQFNSISFDDIFQERGHEHFQL